MATDHALTLPAIFCGSNTSDTGEINPLMLSMINSNFFFAKQPI